MRLLPLLLLIFASLLRAGPYAPAAGEPGSTAIAASDPAIVGWATGFTGLVLGPGTTANPDPDSGATYNPSLVLGPSTAGGGAHPVLPLGDGGRITLTFAQPITNGPGADFAVFENGFDGFLELAFVEVSSNGVDFFRFPGISLTPAAVASFGNLDPTDVHNLAGKYVAGFGTPFDLEDLKDVSPLLNVLQITQVRIQDILGDGSQLDSLGNPVYDPHPTVDTAGFDLDAVAVLHAIPEPSALALLLLGAVWLKCHVRRRR